MRPTSRLKGATLSERVDEACRLAGVNTTRLAAAAGVTFAAAARWRKGRAVPSGEHLRKIAEACHVSVDELLGIYDGMEPPFDAWGDLKKTRVWDELSAVQRKYLAAQPWPPGEQPTLAAYLLLAEVAKSTKPRN